MIRHLGIWQRLLLVVGLIILLLWVNLALAIYFLWQAQGRYRALADTEVPRLVLTGELARHSADLAGLATSVLGGQADEAALLAETRRIDAALAQALAAQPSGTAPVTGVPLRASMQKVIQGTQAQLALSRDIATSLDSLRWLNIDIQDEIEPILRDFDYNIESRMLELRRAESPRDRDALAAAISRERRNRDVFAEIGADAATAMTLIVQGAVADDAERIDQLSTLLQDFATRMAERLSQVPEAPEYLTLRQSLQRLFALVEGDRSILGQRQIWLEARAQSYAAIETTLQGIKALQTRLERLSAHEKTEVLARIEASATGVRRMALWLIGGTFLVGLLGAMALDRLIRTRIVVPLRSLTEDLLATAEGQAPPPPASDDMARLTFAVGEFRRAIAARDRAIADLRTTQDELVQAGKMAALGTLAAGISHELNQPLGAMTYRMALLKSAAEAGDMAGVERQAQLVTALAERMQGIIQHLRRFARRGRFESQTLNLGAMADEAAALLDTRFAETGVRLNIAPGTRAANVTGDPILTEQVILNLLTNAVDAIEDLGPDAPPDRRRIEVAALRQGADWLLHISDTGVGLGNLDPDSAMMPFVSTKEAGRGLGLGLSISYNIMRDMQGDLRISSRDEGQGAVATLRLPCAKEGPTDGT